MEDKPIIIVPPEQSPRRQYVPPKNGTVILFSTDTDPEDALRAALRQSDPAEIAARQPDPAEMREFLLAPPKLPEMHYLPPFGCYPDGRENRRERRRREREAKKHRQKPR